MKGKWIEYSKTELQWLSDNREKPISEYTSEFNQLFQRQVRKENLHALRKRKGWKTGRTGCFEKGSVSHNSGRKQSDYMSADGIEKTKATRFKKGSIPSNVRPLYSERISKDGYVEIKVPERNPHTGAETRFKLKHRWIWETENGPVPAGYMLRFIDGDKTNCTLDNLELMARGVNAILNKRGYEKMPEEVKPTAKLLAQVEHKRSELKRSLEK
ncbi:MAG TPA: HNH endonuclease [Gammaproteobacteria bacterium]|nr:HNH endonuclease [Gammaproteobacteria bacterium]